MRHFLLTLAIPIVASFALAGCGEHTHLGEGIELSNVRINPPLPGQTTGVAFMRIDNHGDTDRLIAVSSSVSDRIELHTHIEEGGVMKMRRVDGIELPHGESVDLKPGSFHVMIFNAEMALGDEVVLTLDFETADDLTVVAPVVMRGEMRQGDMDHGSH
ncbi:hypothetical protein GCM10011309_15880 [Litorimonas cladophorae]|uniref:Copper chaperone PCu(A)C n=1 Tax=Litorimonas cladophorae TaxID=1220491 RepID=A0A918KLJ3_9PROT|nr:copper chaperone PCu(A)C [Litorimonas cladophorae]GGX67062.1 hypothetical protein GCM10011309_15880 [Litorimonas cladophorae]